MVRLDIRSHVWGITGNLGGGKTLSAVGMMVEAMRSGCYVVTNITMRNLGRYNGLYRHICLDDGVDWYALPCGSPRGSGGTKRVMVVIDEVAEWMDQYQTAKSGIVADYLSWLRHSSKRGQDVVIICQRADYINKSLRILIDRWVTVYDLAVWRVPYFRLRVPFGSDLVMQLTFDRLGNRVDGVRCVRKSEYGVYYDTAECLNSSASAAVCYCRPYVPSPLYAARFFLYAFTLCYLLSTFWRLMQHG